MGCLAYLALAALHLLDARMLSEAQSARKEVGAAVPLHAPKGIRFVDEDLQKEPEFDVRMSLC